MKESCKLSGAVIRIPPLAVLAYLPFYVGVLFADDRLSPLKYVEQSRFEFLHYPWAWSLGALNLKMDLQQDYCV